VNLVLWSTMHRLLKTLGFLVALVFVSRGAAAGQVQKEVYEQADTRIHTRIDADRRTHVQRCEVRDLQLRLGSCLLEEREGGRGCEGGERRVWGGAKCL